MKNFPVIVIFLVFMVVMVWASNSVAANSTATGDGVRMIDSHELFDMCRDKRPAATPLCFSYIMASWDAMAVNPYACMATDSAEEASRYLATVVTYIRATSGYADKLNSMELLWNMLRAQNAFTECTPSTTS